LHSTICMVLLSEFASWRVWLQQCTPFSAKMDASEGPGRWSDMWCLLLTFPELFRWAVAYEFCVPYQEFLSQNNSCKWLPWCNVLYRPAQGRGSSKPRTPTSLCDNLIYRKCTCPSPQRDTVKASYGLYAVSLSWINRVTYINRHCTDNLCCFGVN